MSTSKPNTTEARHPECAATTVCSAIVQARSRWRAVRPKERSKRSELADVG
jgi:hypothetical protein